MKRFENKTILVTGASSGIGLAGAKRLIEEGAHVIFTGRTESHVQAAAAELGDHATAVLDDVSDGNTLERIMPVVERAWCVAQCRIRSRRSSGRDGPGDSRTDI